MMKSDKDFFFNNAIDEIIRAQNDRKHEFRYLSLATVNESSPDQRMVVLRKFEKPNSFQIYTDNRSNKIKHIGKNKSICMLFYSRKLQMQIKVHGSASIQTDSNLVTQIWNQQNENSKKQYTSSIDPGSLIIQPKDAHSYVLSDHSHFTIVNIKAYQFDILQLKKEGHIRLLINLQNDGSPELNWIVP